MAVVNFILLLSLLSNALKYCLIVIFIVSCYYLHLFIYCSLLLSSLINILYLILLVNCILLLIYCILLFSLINILYLINTTYLFLS